MQEAPEPVLDLTPERTSEPIPVPGAEQARERKFWTAMAAFSVLAALIWFTVGEGTILVSGRRVEIRVIPLLIIGLFAFRTYVAREADKIRRRSQDQP